MIEVRLDSLWLNLSSEKGHPCHNSWLGCGKNGSIGVLQSIEDNKVDEGLLASTIGSSSTGCQSMPEVEQHHLEVVCIDIIPVW